MPVTAQDFVSAIVTDKYGQFNSWDETRKNFDALLSSARQEARREALKEMDEAHGDYGFGIGVKAKAVEELRQEYLTN